MRIVQRCIAGYFKCKAQSRGIEAIQTGAVTLIQRFGGSLNANVHFHILALEGGYDVTKDGLKFYCLEPPRDEDIEILVATISKRVIRFFTKRGYFSSEEEFKATEVDESELKPYLQSASVASKIALGERAGQRVD